MAIRSVGLCLKPDQPQAAGPILELEKWLGERGHRVLLDPEAGRATRREGCPRDELVAQVDLVVVLGGDGTLLSVARSLGNRSVPVLGVNLGTLGYMTETAIEEMIPALERALAGTLPVESRMRLAVRAERDGQELGSYLALNEAVISKADSARMVELETRADGVEVTTYHADGLIVATPTGSTAYSLSAGGPLVLPGLEAIVLTPICPHTLTQRPAVFPQTCVIEIRVSSERETEVRLTVDGQEGIPLRRGDCVRLRRSDSPLQLLASPSRNRYEILREKLRWGER